MAFDIDNKAGYGPADVPAVDAGPTARRVASGKAPEPVAKSDAELGIDEGLAPATGRDIRRTLQGRNDQITTPEASAAADARARVEDPIANDPLAGMIVQGLPATGLGIVAGEVAGALSPTVAPLVHGAVTGAASTPDRPLLGAALGALPGAAGSAKALVTGAGSRAAERLFLNVGRSAQPAVQRELETMGAERFGQLADQTGITTAADPRAAAESAVGQAEEQVRAAAQARDTAALNALPKDERLYLQVGQLAGKTGQIALDRMGKDRVVGALQRAGVDSMPSAATAAPVINAARANVGKQIGSAYSALDSSGARWSTVKDVLDAAEELRAVKAATSETKPEADAIGQWMKGFVRANRGSESAPVSAASLNRSIGNLQEKGFAASGVDLAQSPAARLGRDLAKSLDTVLDKHLERAARFSPTAKATAEELRQLNKDYGVLKTVQPLVTGRAAAERFRVPAAETPPPPIDRVIAKLGPDSPQARDYRALRAMADYYGGQDATRTFRPKLMDRVAGTTLSQATTAVPRAVAAGASRAANAADVAIARLIGARMAGQVTPQLLQEAAHAGVAPTLLQRFAGAAGRAADAADPAFSHAAPVILPQPAEQRR